jgi:hypothetical protein
MKYLNQLPGHKYTWLPIMYNLVYKLKPTKIIEYGTFGGGTAVTMGLALRDLYETYGHIGHVESYDLFDREANGKYVRDVQGPIPMSISKKLVDDYELNDIVTIDYGDFSKFTSDIKFDLLYFDIGNTGENVLDVYNLCKSSIESGSVILFEGGSHTRDNVPWMLNKQKINSIRDITNYKLLSPESKYSCSIIYNPNIHKQL